MADGDVERIAAGYDAVYDGLSRSPTFQRLWREHSLGADYPEDFEHISFLTYSEMRWMAQALQLSAGSVLVDLACGMGGPGLWIAKTTGAQLVGIDISLVALGHARQRAERLQLATTSRFAPGTFAATGLDNGSADGVMTVDALQGLRGARSRGEEAAEYEPTGRRGDRNGQREFREAVWREHGVRRARRSRRGDISRLGGGGRCCAVADDPRRHHHRRVGCCGV